VRKWRRGGRHRLLRDGFVLSGFKVPTDGRLELRVLGKRKLAAGSIKVRSGKAARLHARLLPAGRRLLKADRKLRSRAVLRFVAKDGRTSQAVGRFSLRRSH
jgi:hypothetical protein